MDLYIYIYIWIYIYIYIYINPTELCIVFVGINETKWSIKNSKGLNKFQFFSKSNIKSLENAQAD